MVQVMVTVGLDVNESVRVGEIVKLEVTDTVGV